MARRKAGDYQDFITFINEHPELNRTQMFTEFKKAGGHIQKKKALDIYRQVTEIQKGELKGKTTREVKKVVAERKPTITVGKTITFDKSHDLSKRILSMYKYRNTDEYLKVGFRIETDTYTTDKTGRGKYRDFGFLIKYDGNIQKDYKKIIKETLKQAKKYYDRLAKKYTTTVAEVQETQNLISQAQDDLKGREEMTVGQVNAILSTYGFHFTGIEHIIFKD